MKSAVLLLIGLSVLAGIVACDRTDLLAPPEPKTRYFELLASRILVTPGAVVDLRVVPPNRRLNTPNYEWHAEAGELLGTAGQQVAWRAPQEDGRYAVASTTADQEGLSWRGVVHITVDPNPARFLKIVFVSDRDGNPEIFTMKPDGSDLTQITFTEDVGHTDPVWSPSTQQIAYVAYDLDEPNIRDLYLVHADGRFRQQMTSDPFQQNSPSWAPGGLQVAYGTRTFSGFQIVAILDVDGYPEIRLSTTLGGLWPDWSVNNRIVFVKPSTPRGSIEIVRNGGGTIASFFVGQEPAWPSWSPDAERIAYVSPTSAPGSIFLIDPQGQNERALETSLAEVGPPVWSNDGRRLVFAGRRKGGDWDLYTLSVEGEDLRRLTFSAAADYSPHWAWLY